MAGVSSIAAAQDGDASESAAQSAPNAAPAPAPGQMVEAAAPSASTTTTSAYGQTFLPAPGANLESHLPSSAQSKSDIYQADSFDLGRSAEPAATLHGNPDSLGVMRNDGSAAGHDPGKALHTVKKGDTLWGICAEQFDDARLWPRIWAYNPQLQNPHWIYPGDQLRMRPVGGAIEADLAPRPGGIRGGTLGGGVVGRTAVVPPETVFLRELGYIDEPEQDVWGEIVGAREEQQLLADGNQIYLILRPGVDVQLGQLMTIFTEAREPPKLPGARRPPGQIIAFKGTAKIQTWDPEKRVARAELVESLDVIERGAKVGPIGRRYYVVPPASSQVDVRATVLTSLYPHEIMGGEQVLFIDRGTNDGLKAGTRLFLVRRGDAWRRTLVTTTDMARSRVRMDVPDRAELEITSLHGDEDDFPEEVFGELRVIRAQRFSAFALVIQAHEEIEPGDQAVARKGM